MGEEAVNKFAAFENNKPCVGVKCCDLTLPTSAAPADDVGTRAGGVFDFY